MIKWLFVLCIRIYQVLFSPWFGGQCLFRVSCSHAILNAVKRNGVSAAIAVFKFRYQYCRPNYKKAVVDGKPCLVYEDGKVLMLDNDGLVISD